ncbi:MAG: nuclear transport factor 2 family protein [Halioglobus sp.]
MPTPAQIRSTVLTYIDLMCRSDIDGLIALYAEDATAEDPVGGNVVRGVEALRGFYAMTAPLLQVELRGPVCVAGNQCAFPLLAQLTLEDTAQYLDAVDVFCFNDRGKITSMRAYWNPAELRAGRDAP